MAHINVNRVLWFEEWKAESSEKRTKHQFNNYIKTLDNEQVQVCNLTINCLGARLTSSQAKINSLKQVRQTVSQESINSLREVR